MAKNRDDFLRVTIDVMAKRVGFLCSNPTCRRSTIGANENEKKLTSIGIPAHITAAAPGGPRYDSNLKEFERKDISNGIWLCSNCAALIDKDEIKFSVSTLNDWKRNAEAESQNKLTGEHKLHPVGRPFLEADLVWRFGGRWSRGFSNENPVEIHEGKPYIIVGSRPIIHWALDWTFKLVVYNNSNYPAYNVKVESIGEEHFRELDRLSKINNLPAFQHLDLRARYEDYVEGDYTVAEKITDQKIPTKLNNLCLKLTYLDDSRQEHNTYIRFTDGEVSNQTS